MKFSRLDPMSGASLIHAEGEWMNGDKKDRRVAVSIGPEIGNVSAMQVEDVIRDANRKGYDDLVFAGFGFDAAAQDAIESGSHPKLRLTYGVDSPRCRNGRSAQDATRQSAFHCVQRPAGERPDDMRMANSPSKLRAWMFMTRKQHPLPDRQGTHRRVVLDTDYDGRTFCICQAFFPDKSNGQSLAKALGDAEVIDEDAFDALSGLKSLPFHGQHDLARAKIGASR